VVVNPAGQVLVGKRLDLERWALLGGAMELKDGAGNCARRELREETGLEAQQASLFGILTDPLKTWITYPNGHEIQSPSYFFEMKVMDGTVSPDDEHSVFEWVSLVEAEHRVKERRVGSSVYALAAY